MKRTAQEIRTLKKELTKTRQLEHKVLAKESREPRGLGLTGKIREKIPEKPWPLLRWHSKKDLR